MNYFSHITHTLALRNNLEKAVNEYLHDNERKVIPAEELNNFKTEILAGIMHLNSIHPRCKPVKANWWNTRQDKDYHLHGAGFCNFKLYASK